MQIQYCNVCGHKVEYEIPDGDNRQRHVCRHCGTIQYQNPKIVAGCIPVWEDRILICKRAIEPRRGYWTIPAGYMELGETVEEGSARETWEEACAEIRDQQLYQIYNLTEIGQVYMIFRGQLLAPDKFGVGVESLEVKLVEEEEIPWDDLAFRIIDKTLRRFLSDRKTGNYPLRIDAMPRDPRARNS